MRSRYKTLYEWWREKMKEKEKRNEKEKVRKFLSGEIDFGVLGKRQACLFRNDKKEKDNQPAFRLMVKEGENWKEVGAFWIRETKPRR